MKKKFKLQDLDCANCAAKMEESIKKIDGVNDAVVSFMTQKMTVDADDARFDEIMDEDHMLDIYDYFKESTTDKIDDALDELGDDFAEEEVRLVRIKFISEMAN